MRLRVPSRSSADLAGESSWIDPSAGLREQGGASVRLGPMPSGGRCLKSTEAIGGHQTRVEEMYDFSLAALCPELSLAQVSVGPIEIELQLVVKPVVQRPLVAQRQ